MSADQEEPNYREQTEASPDVERRESGMPGGGQGRRDETGRSGVYPVSSMEGAGGEAPVRGEMEWGQGERGAAGYEDSGTSEIMVVDGTEIPGLSAFPPAEPREEETSGDVPGAAPPGGSVDEPSTGPLSAQA